MNDQINRKQTSISPEAIVDEILNEWPQLAPVFLQHRMACLGCEMAGFETLADAARIYDVPLAQLTNEMEEALSDGLEPPPGA